MHDREYQRFSRLPSPARFNSGKRNIKWLVVIGIGCMLFTAVVWLRASISKEVEAPASKAYHYQHDIAHNGLELHVLKTTAAHIGLAAIHDNVTNSSFTGINGGFFYTSSLLSIAAVDGKPVNGIVGQYGSGDQNMKYARGTLVWDEKLDKLSVQVVHSLDELALSDPNHYWAQGGISMSLDTDQHWRDQIVLEKAPFPDDDRLRSGIVYDASGNVYLVVTANEGTLSQFREAIIDVLGEHTLVDGVFLDGDGSSQLYSEEMALAGDRRAVVQMITIVNYK
ncbi:hypothetical protein [Paenibacillus aquistagni]|uniref:hypothetical protein n=1 Tax=Paenibacillus aquistagni TaxID=1852522 RepID=UPI00145ADA9F|nr:hypothetical protein [Paenibacillus aquistagni]NMM51102.1 phosphodiester glycosidase family protein [Paenibacillus aquistagni]